MPTVEEIAANQERLYESTSLRDDLNDDEATVLLKWGETQVERIAEAFPDDFEQKCRFLRQVLKNINRFVGQRQYNEFEGQQKYMSKVSMYLPQLGWESISEDQLFAALPEDKTNMNGNLQAILNLLSPTEELPEDNTPSEPIPNPDDGNISVEPPPEILSDVPSDSNITENEAQPLENSNEEGINLSETQNTSQSEDWHDEEE